MQARVNLSSTPSLNIETLAAIVLTNNPIKVWKELIQHIEESKDLVAVINEKFQGKSLLHHLSDKYMEIDRQIKKISLESKEPPFSLNNQLNDLISIVNILGAFGAEDTEMGKTLEEYLLPLMHEEYSAAKMWQYVVCGNKAILFEQLIKWITDGSGLKKLQNFLNLTLSDAQKNTYIQGGKYLKDYSEKLGKHANFLIERENAISSKKIVPWINDKVQKNTLNIPSLSECSCLNFDRDLHPRRLNLENQLINNLVQDFSKTTSLKYLSLGVGELLQDFIQVWKIMPLYNKLDVILIEHQFNNESIAQFKILNIAALEMNVELKVHFFNTITEYEACCVERGLDQVHIVNIVDFPAFYNSFDDIMKAHRLMNEAGKLYFSTHLFDFCFSKTQCVAKKEWNLPEYIKRLSKKLQEEKALHKETIYYANLNNDVTALIRFISQFDPVSCKKLHIMQLQPCEIDENEKKFTTNKNLHFTSEDLQYFLKLFAPRTMDLEITFIDSIAEFKRMLATTKCQYDVVSWLGDFNEAIKEGRNFIEWAKQNMPSSVLLYYFGKHEYEKESKEVVGFESPARSSNGVFSFFKALWSREVQPNKIEENKCESIKRTAFSPSNTKSASEG